MKANYLRSVRLRSAELPEGFPFTLPIIRNLGELQFSSAVTILIGENGSGKSTLLEGMAVAMTDIAIGSGSMSLDPTLAPARALADAFRIVRGTKPKTCFFLRAEDLFGFQKRMAAEMQTLKDMEEEFEAKLEGYGRQLAVGSIRGQRMALEHRYGANPDALSHGEVFLSILQSRLVPNGLYFLDEPETPLSPTRVLALIAIIKDRVAQGCQFVVATHSPMLMAFPGADTLVLQEGSMERVPYDEIEHVVITRSFLQNPESFLSKL